MVLTINFWLNGQIYYTTKKQTLSNIIQYFNLNQSLLVLEHNGFVCNKKMWSEIFVSNDDQIEIVTIVGGG